MTEQYPFFREEDEQTLAVIGAEAAASDLNGTYLKPYAVLTQKRLYCKNEGGNFIVNADQLRSAGAQKAASATVPLIWIAMLLTVLRPLLSYLLLMLNMWELDSPTYEALYWDKLSFAQYISRYSELFESKPFGIEIVSYPPEALLQNFFRALLPAALVVILALVLLRKKPLLSAGALCVFSACWELQQIISFVRYGIRSFAQYGPFLVNLYLIANILCAAIIPLIVIGLSVAAIFKAKGGGQFEIRHSTGAFSFREKSYPQAELTAFAKAVEALMTGDRTHV